MTGLLAVLLPDIAQPGEVGAHSLNRADDGRNLNLFAQRLKRVVAARDGN